MKTTTDEIQATAACFRQRVNLPAAQVAGLADAELATALCFEVEPFSGIPRAQGELAWVRLTTGDPARAVFDVVQIRAVDLAEEVARARAAKRRVKFVTAVPSANEDLAQLPKIPVRARRGLRCSAAAVWTLVCLLALGALACETLQVRAETRRLQGRVAVQRRLQAEKSALAGQIDAVRRETESLRQRRIDEARAQQNVQALRGAWPALLAAVPDGCRDEGVVSGVRATGAYAATLTGVALSAEAAARACVRLTETLAAPKSGWRVRPGAIGTAAGGGTVTFACDVVFDEEGQFK